MATPTHYPPAAAALAQRHPHRRFSLDDARAVSTLAQQDSRLGRKTREALAIIDDAIGQFGLDSVALSFNGGKDCTVLVHLLATAILRHCYPAAFTSAAHPTSAPTTAAALPPIPTVYVRCAAPFPQVEAFVALCTQWYHLALVAIDGGMRAALQTYLDRPHPLHHSPPKAILVGTRRNDPHGANLEPLQRTDPGWPDFVRVHPVLDWHYADIWAFLRADELSLGAGGDGEVAHGGGLEWCELYDYGYTSLGSTHNTFPNPLLRAPPAPAEREGDEHDLPQPLGGWGPAWELQDEAAERAGRETSVAAVLARTAPSTPSSPASRSALPHALALGLNGVRLEGGTEEGDVPIGSNPPSRAGSPVPGARLGLVGGGKAAVGV